jgi:two-component system phosphate regulon sensor histidine kinase PhoR
MKRNINLRLLSYTVIAYMMLAFAWWSVLLFVKNRDAYMAKRDKDRIVLIARGVVRSDAEYFESDYYKDLTRKYKSQEWMILGESAVFVLSLVIGIWLINRGYNKEVHAARQQRNFLLSITHELKSPIASIRLVLETLAKRRLKKEQSEKLNSSALKELDRLNGLVNDLLLSARLETAYQLNLEPVQLDELLSELLDEMQAKYPNAQFSFQANEESVVVNCDKTGLTSVALNLLENAVKYSGKQPRIDLLLESDEKKVVFSVIDNGIGIEDKEKKNIFNKFYRVGSEDTRKTKGTGLGLYIVRQIVRAHKGSIDVVNNKPQGTVFIVTLPYNPAEVS